MWLTKLLGLIAPFIPSKGWFWNRTCVQRVHWERYLSQCTPAEEATLGNAWGVVGDSRDRLGDYLRLKELLKSHVNDLSVVCEVGCLGGKWLKVVKQARRIVAVDICPASEAFVRRALSDFEGQLDFYLTKGDELNGICDQSIDLVFSIDCLVRVPRKSITAYIKESARVLNPGGTRLQNLHSWASVYWYKNDNYQYSHIDNYGELALFVNFTEKGVDYEEGGLSLKYIDRNICLDDNYNYGDAILFDQSQVFHEVLPIKTIGKQIGRMQLYVPTIPPNYTDKVLKYAGHPYRFFFADESISVSDRIISVLKDVRNRKPIHYSRGFFRHFEVKI